MHACMYACAPSLEPTAFATVACGSLCNQLTRVWNACVRKQTNCRSVQVHTGATNAMDDYPAGRNVGLLHATRSFR